MVVTTWAPALSVRRMNTLPQGTTLAYLVEKEVQIREVLMFAVSRLLAKQTLHLLCDAFDKTNYFYFSDRRLCCNCISACLPGYGHNSVSHCVECGNGFYSSSSNSDNSCINCGMNTNTGGNTTASDENQCCELNKETTLMLFCSNSNYFMACSGVISDGKDQYKLIKYRTTWQLTQL